MIKIPNDAYVIVLLKPNSSDEFFQVFRWDKPAPVPMFRIHNMVTNEDKIVGESGLDLWIEKNNITQECVVEL